MKKYLLIILSILGVVDSVYLTSLHYKNLSAPCGLSISDCNLVLTSSYSEIFGIPLSLLGLVHYSLLVVFILLAITNKNKLWKRLVVIQSSFGLATSFCLVFLQLFVIHAICTFCMGSALISLLIFAVAITFFSKERQRMEIFTTGAFYRNIVKPVFFAIDADIIHARMISFVEFLGKIKLIKEFFSFMYVGYGKKVKQKIFGINFNSPIVLAA